MPKINTQPPLEKRGIHLLRLAEKVPRFRTSRQAKALIEAIHYQDSDLAVWLLKHGVDPRAKDNKGRSALWWAATYCQPVVIREIVRRGAKLPDDVLMGPVTGAQPSVVSFLIQHGANVNCVASKYSPLGHLHIKEVLLTAALRTAVARPTAQSIPIMLIRAGADVNRLILQTPFMMAINRSMLGMAAYSGSLRIVKAMLAAGARVNLKDNRGRTALFDALEQGHYSIAKELLRVGAKTNVRDRNEMTPLETLRQQENSPDMTGTEWLISAGVSVDAKKQEAERAAWQRRRAQMITFLEKHSRNGK